MFHELTCPINPSSSKLSRNLNSRRQRRYPSPDPPTHQHTDQPAQTVTDYIIKLKQSRPQYKLQCLDA